MLSRVVDDIHLLKLPIPYDLEEMNSYLVEGKNGFTILDTGDDTEETKEIWRKVFAEYPIEKAVITHCHYDHMGLAGWMQEQFGIPIWMSDQTYEEQKRMKASFIGEEYVSHLPAIFREYGGPEIVENNEYYTYDKYQFTPDRLFSEDEFIYIGDHEFRPIWTPGHSPDHFCFYDSQREILFVGDHLLETINPIVLIQKSEDNPLKGYMQAIQKIEKYPVQYMLTGHLQMITDPSKRIMDLKKHYRKRWEQIYEQVDYNGKNAFEISKGIYGSDVSIIRSISGFMQTITNLEYLQSTGSIKKEKREDCIYFYK